MLETEIAPCCGWFGTVRRFLRTPEKVWLDRLGVHHTACMNMGPSRLQKEAWVNCYAILRGQLTTLVENHHPCSDWCLFFEYELPRERGRRPDLVVLAGAKILVLEFKDSDTALQSHIDQVAAYARDLGAYHAGSHNRTIMPMRVLTDSTSENMEKDGVWAVSPSNLPTVLQHVTPEGPGEPINPESWLEADYSPLPSLVTAARTIFENKPLPRIRRAQSAGIPQTLHELVAIAERAQRNREHHLAMVIGVPGAGKTLVGLQFVYKNCLDDLEGRRTAIFLSGNGPLIRVLQHALESRVFVQDVHGFLKQYGTSRDRVPEEHIWVFDEAQRAWDANRVGEKRRHEASEPEEFLRLGKRMDSWSLVVGLIGEGQEIHTGEESGLQQWNDAIATTGGDRIVHCPDKIVPVFSSADQVFINERLNLSMSLRSHLAQDVHEWVTRLLEGRLRTAAECADRISYQGFRMYVTQDLDAATDYVQDRYAGQIDKRFGMLASSKAKNLERHGVRNNWGHTLRLKIGPWYNDPPDSPSLCCALQEVATEFACQGLELDFPIVCWGDYLTWDADNWRSKPRSRSRAHDPHRLRLNSYRVLLSRGRDGFAIFVPGEARMSATYAALVQAGCVEL